MLKTRVEILEIKLASALETIKKLSASVEDVSLREKELKRRVVCGASGHTLGIKEAVNGIADCYVQFRCTQCGFIYFKYSDSSRKFDFTPQEQAALDGYTKLWGKKK